MTALAFALLVDDPARFRDSREVGAYFGLVPRLDESSEQTPQLGISKRGDALGRRSLVNAAHYILGRVGPPSALRRAGEGLMVRGGPNAKKRAVVAVARKLAVLLHHLWVTGQDYRPEPPPAETPPDGARPPPAPRSPSARHPLAILGGSAPLTPRGSLHRAAPRRVCGLTTTDPMAREVALKFVAPTTPVRRTSTCTRTLRRRFARVRYRRGAQGGRARRGTTTRHHHPRTTHSPRTTGADPTGRAPRRP